ncbi:MAG: hypothetical protein AB1458_00050 [Bacteroidota bacterium]
MIYLEAYWLRGEIEIDEKKKLIYTSQKFYSDKPLSPGKAPYNFSPDTVMISDDEWNWVNDSTKVEYKFCHKRVKVYDFNSNYPILKDSFLLLENKVFSFPLARDYAADSLLPIGKRLLSDSSYQVIQAEYVFFNTRWKKRDEVLVAGYFNPGGECYDCHYLLIEIYALSRKGQPKRLVKIKGKSELYQAKIYHLSRNVSDTVIVIFHPGGASFYYPK